MKKTYGVSTRASNSKETNQSGRLHDDSERRGKKERKGGKDSERGDEEKSTSSSSSSEGDYKPKTSSRTRTKNEGGSPRTSVWMCI